MLTENEIEGILKLAKKKYYDNNLPYLELYNLVIYFKITNIKNGLMESSQDKMDLYLIGLFQKFEEKKKNFIHINNLTMALRNSNKIILSNIQVNLKFDSMT